MALFWGILFFVGIDVGLNTAIPKFLMERTGLGLEQAGLGTSLYFGARVGSSLIGAFILLRCPSIKFLRWNIWVMLCIFSFLFWTDHLVVILILLFLIGLTCANIFSILLGIGLHVWPERTNEVTSIILMGVAGGALTTPIMGLQTMPDKRLQCPSLV